MADANKDMESEEVRDAIRRIEENAELIFQASDVLRSKLILLCGSASRRFKTAEEAERIRLDFKKKGWDNIQISDNEVNAEGTLISRVKKAGLGYVSRKAFFTDCADSGQPLFTYKLAFGRLYGRWQFYVFINDEIDDENFIEKSLEGIERDVLPLIAEDIPRFLHEFSDFVEKKKAEFVKLPAYAERLDQLVRLSDL